MKNTNYKNLVNILSNNGNIVNTDDIDILIKSIPDSSKEGVLDPRVYNEKLKPKRRYIIPNQYIFDGVPVGEMRLGMGWPNIDISKDVVARTKSIDLGDRNIDIRIYSPVTHYRNMKCMIFIHGGGFFGGDVDVVENPCKLIADKANAVVISINYRLAPENPFPCGLDDCFDVLMYVYNNPGEFNIDKNKIAISGDSAGGNIATVCSIRDRNLKTNMIKYVALLYPVVTLSDKEDSYYSWDIDKYDIRSDNKLMERTIRSLENTMDIIKKLYLQGKVSEDNVEVSPLLSNLRGLPETLVITAEYDFLRVQGEAYLKKLMDSGVKAKGIRYKGMDHAFIDKCGYYPQAEDCINEIVKDMNAM